MGFFKRTTLPPRSYCLFRFYRVRVAVSTQHPYFVIFRFSSRIPRSILKLSRIPSVDLIKSLSRRSISFIPHPAITISAIQIPASILTLIPQSVKPGATIGDGDRKRAPFLVLGLAPWYGTIFLFLEQIAPSPSTHARKMLRGFLRMRRSRNGVQNSRNLLGFWPTTWHNSTRLCLLEFCWSIFVVSCSNLNEVRQCRF